MSRTLYTNLLALLFWLGLVLPLVAQSGNPFEIIGRENLNATIPATTSTVDSTDFSDVNNLNNNSLLAPTALEQVEDVAVEEITNSYQTDANNPFEIIRDANVNISPRKDPVQKKKTVLEKEKKEPGTNTNNLLFWLLTAVLIGLAFFITIYRNYLTKVYRSFTNHNILRLSYREQGSGIAFPYLMLYGLFFINMSIFAFLGLTKFYPNQFSTSPTSLLQIGGIVAGAYLVKHLVLNFLNYVFRIKPELQLYNFTIMIFNNLLGIALVPLNFAIAFAYPSLAKTLIIIGLAIISLVFLFRALRSFLLAMKLFSFHKFHFFIYLCAVEIAPVLVLIKYLMIQNGIQ